MYVCRYMYIKCDGLTTLKQIFSQVYPLGYSIMVFIYTQYEGVGLCAATQPGL